MKMYLKGTEKEVIAKVVCTFETDDKTQYIVLTDKSKNSAGKINVTAYTYEDEGEKRLLTPIKKEEENLVYEAIEHFRKIV